MISSYLSTYLYLHGFASSPRSEKARYLRDRFQSLNLTLHTPDLNQNDFSHLTLTRQLQQVAVELPSHSVTLIGSSFGGLTAAWLGEQYPQIERLILLAPAFQFLRHWLPKLADRVQHWQTEGYLPVYHYGEAKELPLHYQFIVDAAQYSETRLQRPVPTLILHGTQDEVIPLQSSLEYAAQRSWVKLIELDSDHALGNVSDRIWQEIQRFCDIR